MTEQELAELRVYALSMQHFEPILLKRQKVAVDNLIRKFNEGGDVTREAAKIAALDGILKEVESKLRKFEALSK